MGWREDLGAVEAVVKVRVHVVRLVGEQRAEGAGAAREPAVASIEIVAVRDRRASNASTSDT